MIIKICGLTLPEEADFLNHCNADLAGMVLFFPKSKRNISLEQAARIKERLNPSIKTVAVTVSPTMEQVLAIEQAGFDYLQLHGTAPQELFAHQQYSQDSHIPVLKAFNIKDMDQYDTWQRCPGIAGYVFDAAEPGSGRIFDWTLIKQLPRDGKLFILAGGLNACNVAKAISYLHPDGVDVSSGVEYPDRPGKDPARIEAFVRAARSVFPDQ